MIDGGAPAVPVFLKTCMVLGLSLGVMHGPVTVTAIGKSPADSDRADGIQSICVLHDKAFDGFHLVFRPRSFEGNVHDDLADLSYDLGIEVARFHPRSGALRSFISILIKLPIIKVMQQ